MALTSSDLNLMQSWGRFAATENDNKALMSAAEYLATCEPEEVKRLWFFWEEGVRNYARTQQHCNELHRRVRGEAAAIKMAANLPDPIFS